MKIKLKVRVALLKVIAKSHEIFVSSLYSLVFEDLWSVAKGKKGIQITI